MNMPYQQPMMNYTPNYGAYQYNPMASYQRYQQPEQTQGISGRVVMPRLLLPARQLLQAMLRRAKQKPRLLKLMLRQARLTLQRASRKHKNTQSKPKKYLRALAEH